MDSAYKTIVIPTRTGVQSLQLPQISIYPNPAKNYLMINGAEPTDVLTVFNLYGQVVIKTTITGQTIPLPESLQSGVYSAVITTGFGKVVIKLVIER